MFLLAEVLFFPVALGNFLFVLSTFLLMNSCGDKR